MQTNYLKNLTIIFFLGLLLFPSLFFYPFGSLSYGIIIFSSLLVSYALIFHNNLFTAKYLNLFIRIYPIIICLIFLHFLIITLFASNVNYIRFFLSFIALIIFFLATTVFSSLLIKIYELNFFDIIFKIIFYIILLLSFLGILRYSSFSPFYYNTNIYLTIFSEPSHLAISILPFIAYFILSAKNFRTKIKLIFLFLVISLLLKSATLLVAIFLFLFLFFSLRQLFNLLLFLILICFIVYIAGLDKFLETLIDFKYFHERLTLNMNPDDKVNLSVLIFLAGYHEIYLNLKNTLYTGIGFQQLGFLGEQSFIKELIFLNSGTFEYSRNKDASFLFGKYISEFGLFGIITILFYFKYFINNLIDIKKEVSKDNNLNLFFSACVISFPIELFLRGAGYFTTSSFLLLVSIFGQKLLKYNDKEN